VVPTWEGCTKGFDFRRLGIRVTSYIISPWIPKNLAIKKPHKENSEWDLTSAIASAKVLCPLCSMRLPTLPLISQSFDNETHWMGAPQVQPHLLPHEAR
jgi:hypothetical protein